MITNYYVLSIVYMGIFSVTMLGILQIFKIFFEKKTAYTNEDEYGL